MTKEETDLIIAEQNKSTAEILEVIDKVKADFQELCDMRHRQVIELEKENADFIKKIFKLVKINNKLKEQNAEAKRIIKKLTEFANLEIEYDPEHPEEHTKSWSELCKQAEDFIKE